MNNKEHQAETEVQQSKNAELLPSAPLLANPMLCAVLVKDVEQTKNMFPWTGKNPEWLKYYLLLIKTRRKSKHYIVKGLSFVGKFRVDGFDKFKVIGYRELS